MRFRSITGPVRALALRLTAVVAVATAVSLVWQPPAYAVDENGWDSGIVMDGTDHAALGLDDPLAALEAVDYALREVGDGATYVWHRVDAGLEGAVRPVATFRGPDGEICRRLSVTLTLGQRSKWTQATACREAGGSWAFAQ